MPLRSGLAGPRVWFWTMRRAFAWFSLQTGLVAPILMAEFALLEPSYRQNIVTLVVLYLAAGAIPVIVSVPFAIRYRRWRSLAWIPTWFAYAFLRRLATLEAVITLPVRPVRVPVPATVADRLRTALPGRPAAAPLPAQPATAQEAMRPAN